MPKRPAVGAPEGRGNREWRGGSTRAGKQLLEGWETEAELGAGSTDGIQGRLSQGLHEETCPI